MVEVGRRIAGERECKGLSFTSDFTQCSDSEVLLTCGTIQYLERGLADMLAGLAMKPRHILVNKSPMYEGPTYYTLQNTGYSICPYRIYNRVQFIESRKSLGYDLIDSWPQEFDDSSARRDWGWQPAYDLDAMSDDFLAELKA